MSNREWEQEVEGRRGADGNANVKERENAEYHESRSIGGGSERGKGGINWVKYAGKEKE